MKAIITDGPSCSGKSTLLKNLDGVIAISHTTRPIRPGEENGVDYFFISEDEFKRLESLNEFIEVNNIHGNLYGLTKNELLRKLATGKLVLLDVESKGLISILNSNILPRDKTLVVFIDCSENEFKNRMLKRDGCMNETRIKNGIIERERYIENKEFFDKYIDSTHLTPSEIRDMVLSLLL